MERAGWRKTNMASRLHSFASLGFLGACALSAAQISTSVPNAFQNAAGGGTFLGPLANTARTYQLLIHSSQLTAHQGRTITSLSYRLLPSASSPWPASSITFNNYDIRLSGSVDPSARSLTFANNVVGSQSLVRSGSLTMAAGSHPSGGNPNAFGSSINFQSGYAYSGGNLLVEIRHDGFTGTSASVDSVLATNTAAGYGTLFSAAWGSGIGATSGNQGNFSVIQLTSVPEPATIAAIAMGLGVIARRRRNRR